MKKPAPTKFAIHDLISGRWSARALADTPIESEKIRVLLEAARWAPSSYNIQPWRFIVWEKKTDLHNYERAFNTLVSFNQRWAKPAPILIGVFSNKLDHKGKLNKMASYDTGAATFALTLQAHALGLIAHQMTGYDQKKLCEEFMIPEDFESLVIITIASYGDPMKLDATLYKQEIGPRNRLLLSQVAFINEWGKKYLD